MLLSLNSLYEELPLIRELPKQPPVKAVMSWQSTWIAGPSDVLIMQRMGYVKNLSASSVLELEVFDRIFDENLTASNAEAPDALFADDRKGSSRQP